MRVSLKGTRTRVVAVALVAVFALSVFASSAGADPVFYTKVQYGATANTPVKFTGTVASGFLEGNVSKSKIECSAGTVSGEVTGPKITQNNVATFTGCKASGFPCNSAGEPEGVIRTFSLKGELGDVKTGIPGLRVFRETGKGGELAEFACANGAITVKVRGSVIGQLGGAAGSVVSEGKFASTNKLTFAQAGGIQKWNKFLGEAVSEQLEAKVGEGEYEKSGESVVMTLKGAGVSNLGFTQ